ncbi:hypothetical protein OPV22_030253 [Ensete ventricosum]|uniref:Uncharacterized protein n=1 Tax=Ensete ventricosum TaxID=4639 RepID=A0AAV8P6W5_ENSVE|nr:hypothetical protein OPV22_030253 [Ensete ventricosum]
MVLRPGEAQVDSAPTARYGDEFIPFSRRASPVLLRRDAAAGDVARRPQSDPKAELKKIKHPFGLSRSITGNREGGSGKVIDSKADDRIFIYYTDHGGPGVLGMPNMPYLFTSDFIGVLKKNMHPVVTKKWLSI